MSWFTNLRDAARNLRAVSFDPQHYPSSYRDRLRRFNGRDRYRWTLDYLSSHLPPGPLLDVGCGVGTALDYFQQRQHPDAVGIDIYQWWRDRDDCLLYDGDRFPFPDSQFAAVVCIHTLAHVADPEQTLGEIARVLQPQGVAAIVTPNQVYSALMTPRNLLSSYQPDLSVLRKYHQLSLAQALQRHGLAPFQTHYSGDRPHAALPPFTSAQLSMLAMRCE